MVWQWYDKNESATKTLRYGLQGQFLGKAYNLGVTNNPGQGFGLKLCVDDHLGLSWNKVHV